MMDLVKQYLQDSGYEKEYRKGIEALKNEHRSKIKVKNPRNLKGSMDLDKACERREPNAPRWDYFIVVCKNGNDSENLALIEVHGAANFGEVEVMIKKKEWLVRWLSRTKLRDLKKEFFWISTGKITITSQSKYAKRLAASGVRRPMKVTPLLDTEVEYK
jgi:hypothetical protein